MNVPRLLWVGWRFYVKNLTLSSFYILTSVLQPIIFASVAYFMFEAGAREGTLLYVALGAGMMGIWSSTLFGSGGAIQWQRWQGVLEYSIAVPPPLLLVIVPLTIATASIGLYSLTATLFWGWLFFDVPLDVAHPIAFLVALPAAVLGLGLLGLVLASTFVLYRNANALEPPRVPRLARDRLARVAVAAPGLGGAAVLGAGADVGHQRAPRGRDRGQPWPEIGMCLFLSAVYLVIGHYALRHFERLARERATLAIA